MKCKNCGVVIQNNSEYCPNCGQLLDSKSSIELPRSVNSTVKQKNYIYVV